MLKFHRLSPLALAACFAACSGGGSGPLSPPQTARSSAPAASAPSNASASTVKATFTLTIPKAVKNVSARRSAAKRRRAYVSPSSLGAVLVATGNTPADDASYGYDLSTSGACASNEDGTTCTLSFPLHPDTYSIEISLYDRNEDGVTPGAGSPAAPAGNLLSTDTESETVVPGMVNTFNNFLLRPFVTSFAVGNYGSNFVVGVDSQTPIASSSESQIELLALDADTNAVDFQGGQAPYANAPFATGEVESGDTTGCSGPCITAANDTGMVPAATISSFADTTFTFGGSGFGGPGAGIENSVNGAAPAGTHPYEVTFTAKSGGTAAGTFSVVPLFGYPQTNTLDPNSTIYVWAAQAQLPTGATAGTGSYTASFANGGATCTASSTSIATVGTGTYFPGYGKVFPVTSNGSGGGTCTLSLSDGGAVPATVSVAINVGAPAGGTITIPCPGQTGSPTGNALKRSAVARRRFDGPVAGSAPVLVQYANGQAQATLAQPVSNGDTLVAVVGDTPGEPATNPLTHEFAGPEDDDTFVYLMDLTASGAVTVKANDGCNTAIWVGEFYGTSTAAVESANAAALDTTDAATSPSIVPNAANGLLLTFFVPDTVDTSAAAASAGYTDYFSFGPFSSLDVQLATAPTTDTTDPVSTTFGGVAHTRGESGAFQIPPANFTGSPPPSETVRERHSKKR